MEMSWFLFLKDRCNQILPLVFDMGNLQCVLTESELKLRLGWLQIARLTKY